jgi:hypothetical protein
MSPNDSRTPTFYGFPNIHKPDVSSRPVVCAAGFLTPQLARYLQHTSPKYSTPGTLRTDLTKFLSDSEETRDLGGCHVRQLDKLITFHQSPDTRHAEDRTVAHNSSRRSTESLQPRRTLCEHSLHPKESSARKSKLRTWDLHHSIRPLDFDTEYIGSSRMKPKCWHWCMGDVFAIFPHG